MTEQQKPAEQKAIKVNGVKVGSRNEVVVPKEILDAAAVAGGDFVQVVYDPKNRIIIIVPIDMKPRVEIN